jgi:hypothetical protein
MREIAQHCTDDERAVSGTVSEPVSLLPEQFARAASAPGLRCEPHHVAHRHRWNQLAARAEES